MHKNCITIDYNTNTPVVLLLKVGSTQYITIFNKNFFFLAMFNMHTHKKWCFEKMIFFSIFPVLLYTVHSKMVRITMGYRAILVSREK